MFTFYRNRYFDRCHRVQIVGTAVTESNNKSIYDVPLLTYVILAQLLNSTHTLTPSLTRKLLQFWLVGVSCFQVHNVSQVMEKAAYVSLSFSLSL